MEKCIVINRIPLGNEGKLRRKHLEQVEAFRNMGFDTYYVAFDDGKCYLMHNDGKEYICNSSIHGYNSYIAMFKAVQHACKKYGPFDLAYMRMIPATPALLNFLRKVRPSIKKFAYEFPTFPYDAERSKKGGNPIRRMAGILDRCCRNSLKKYVDLAIVLTADVDNVFGIPAIFLRNGIHVEEYKLKEVSKTNGKIEILCMGKLQRWHGYDRMIAGAIAYKNKHGELPFYLHILGEGNARQSLMEQAKQGGLDESSVDFPGIVVGEQLDQYFDKCLFAVESLGLHRLNLTYSSTLKSREYLARGIPFAYSLTIPGIDETCDFCFRIPVDESPVDMEALLEWSQNLADDCGLQMRQYAKDHFSWESQFALMISAMEK